MNRTFSNHNARHMVALAMLKAEDALRDDTLKKFTQLASVASELLAIPAGFVSVLDHEHPYIMVSCNFALKQGSLHDAFCFQTLLYDCELVCCNTHLAPDSASTALP